MVAIERDNVRLKGVLPKDYARPALEKHRLGELIDLIGTILLISPLPRDRGEGHAGLMKWPESGEIGFAGKMKICCAPPYQS